MNLLPDIQGNALDIGARDGHFSRLLAEKFHSVTALDLEKPAITHERINCVKGDITELDFDDGTFDIVFCVEVLEHIPAERLAIACRELSRISKSYLLIGVPYKQDLRVGRTTCSKCGSKNPPWGHINTFGENRLKQLFSVPDFKIEKLSFVGSVNLGTNPISTFLMDLAGNPYGTYNQEEPCVYYGGPLGKPIIRNLPMKVYTRLAIYLNKLQKPFLKTKPNWIHILFKKS